jgi:hypothetical protein
MKKISIILVFVLGFVAFSGYRALAAEDIFDDVEVVETSECPMHQEGTQLRTQTRKAMGQMMNQEARQVRKQQRLNQDGTCPCLNQEPTE